MTENSIAIVVCIIMIAFLVPLIISQRIKKKTMENTVKAFALSYMIGSIFLLSSTFALIILIGRQALWLWIFYGVIFLLLGIGFTLYGFVWSITYDSSGFTYRKFYGKKTTIAYSSVTKINVITTTIHIYVNKKHFYVDLFAAGAGDFLIKLSKGLSKEAKNPTVTKVNPPKVGHIVGGVLVVFFIYGLGTVTWEITKGISPLDLKRTIIIYIGGILMTYIFLHECFWSLTFDSLGFTYRTFYGKKTRVAYSSITKIKSEKTCCHIHANKKRFRVDYYAINFDEFYEKLPRGLCKNRPRKKRFRKKRS